MVHHGREQQRRPGVRRGRVKCAAFDSQVLKGAVTRTAKEPRRPLHRVVTCVPLFVKLFSKHVMMFMLVASVKQGYATCFLLLLSGDSLTSRLPPGMSSWVVPHKRKEPECCDGDGLAKRPTHRLESQHRK